MLHRSFKPVYPKSMSHCSPSQSPRVFYLIKGMRTWQKARLLAETFKLVFRQLKAKDGVTQLDAQGSYNQKQRREEAIRTSILLLLEIIFHSFLSCSPSVLVTKLCWFFCLSISWIHPTHTLGEVLSISSITHPNGFSANRPSCPIPSASVSPRQHIWSHLSIFPCLYALSNLLPTVVPTAGSPELVWRPESEERRQSSEGGVSLKLTLPSLSSHLSSFIFHQLPIYSTIRPHWTCPSLNMSCPFVLWFFYFWCH